MGQADVFSESLTNDMAVFRRFNRMYTQYLGTLNEGLLESEFSLAEARVLYELANREAPRASDLVDGLVMDAGYVSRIVGKFEREGLLKRKASVEDARSVELMLTAKGRAAFKKLNARSDKQARGVLEALTPTSRKALVGCMVKMKAMLEKKEKPRAFVLRPHRIGDMGWVVQSESVGYAEQFGWDGGFEALVAQIVSEFLAKFDPVRERCWIAEVEGHRVGHIFLVKHPSELDTAKLRLLFVETSARGLGLGDALVQECIRFARGVGYKKVVLWTQSILGAAHRIYGKAGFRLVKEEPHHSFGKDLIGQEWELDLV
jgi:DNA-binding MarR family transcriptional regulator/GNAT superfamily N-acetyltransferase